MSIEAAQLKDKPEMFEQCPKCGARPFKASTRGELQSAFRKWLRRPYCAVLCSACKKIVGYEKP